VLVCRGYVATYGTTGEWAPYQAISRCLSTRFMEARL
jgi:hypothetical protein